MPTPLTFAQYNSDERKLARRVDDMKGTAIAMSCGVIVAAIASACDNFPFTWFGLAIAMMGAIGTVYLVIMIERQLISMYVLSAPVNPERVSKLREEISRFGDDDVDF